MGIMKGLKIGLIAALVMIMFGLCGILVLGIRHTKDGFPTRTTYTDMQLVLDEEVSLDGIDRINIQYDMNSNDVYFYEGEGDTLRVKEYAGYEADEGEISTVEINGNTLEIKGKRRNTHTIRIFGFGYSSGYGYTEIWLPDSYRNALEVKTSSGTIRADFDIVLDGELSFTSSSGDMTLKEVSAAVVEITATSGRINGTGLCAADGDGEIVVQTSSGDVRIEQFMGNTTIETTSGRMEVETIAGSFSGSSSSGDITVGMANGNAVVSTNSGIVKIRGGSGTRNISTSSGDVLIEKAEDVFEVSTTSGRAVVEAEKGAGSIETSSGDVRLTLPELTGELKIRTNSGRVDIGFSKDEALMFEVNTTSGDIATFFDDSLSFSKKGNHAKGTIGNEEQAKEVTIETSSGDVRIKGD